MINLEVYPLLGIEFYKAVTQPENPLKIAIPNTVATRELVNDVYICTKGSYTTHLENGDQADENGVLNSPWSVRNTGFYSEEIPYGRKRGIYWKKCEKPSEWWCCKKSDLQTVGLKPHTKIHLQAGQSLNLLENAVIVILQGSCTEQTTGTTIISPKAVTLTAPRSILASEELIALSFNKL